MLSWVVCSHDSLFQKAFLGPEGRREDSDEISLDSSWALLSKIQTGKCWRSCLSSLSGLAIPLLLNVMCMHNVSWAFATLKVVIWILWDTVKHWLFPYTEEFVTHFCIFWIPCNNSVYFTEFICPKVSGRFRTCIWRFWGWNLQPLDGFCQVPYSEWWLIRCWIMGLSSGDGDQINMV